MTEIRINPDDPESIRRALNTEWLLTNGLGGYAMGTVLGVNTRRYHGLLVAATKPPVGRIVALHSMIEQLVIPRADGSEEVIDLSTQMFGNEMMLHPNGWKALRYFKYNQSMVVWHLEFPNLLVRRKFEFAVGSHRSSISYEVDTSVREWRLRVRPFMSPRDFHSLNSPEHEGSPQLDGDLQIEGSTFLNITHNATRTDIESQTWNNFAYPRDRERGQQWLENIWSPCCWEFDAKTEQPLNVSFAASVLHSGEPSARKRIPPWNYRRVKEPENSLDLLRHAASCFVVERWQGDLALKTVIAGYPWFGDWGRDTMISLPGLMLCTGRFEEARSTLLTFARHLRNGLIPNLFDDYGGAAHYNTVDASLWFVHAVHQLWISTPPPLQGGGWGVGKSSATHKSTRSTPTRALPLQGGGSFDELFTACRTIIAAYKNGTDFNIRMDEDSLITAGDENSQLTWMDAKRDGVVFTPRHGKAVEINALWFNALRCMAEMTSDESERDQLIALSENVSRSFREKFWWRERECLHDVLIPRDATSRNGSFVPDSQLRPNQIFAVSLPYSPLNEDQQRAVVKIVGERLLTPFGLRTLDRDDPKYRGRYEGNLFQRDAAYHNGTVWPWLIGPYCDALLRINKFRDDSKSLVKRIIQPLLDELENTEGGRCLGQLAEVYDGDSPHRPNGCPAQAWSVAEVLRVLTLIEGE